MTLHVEHCGGKDVGYVEEHMGGEGAAHFEVCEYHLLSSCRAIGGGPLAQGGFDVGNKSGGGTSSLRKEWQYDKVRLIQSHTRLLAERVQSY
ncbi:hypothetical protein E2C01_012454 [Portunus trituberculatus]|uniref:Uncharacterized protein n=1 Tax=Portunus trituberculatus TaxID=210409 RepID=A0A5B7DE81_PORTR|nr:hypothetical protein [Portunus trituberculatus]